MSIYDIDVINDINVIYDIDVINVDLWHQHKHFLIVVTNTSLKYLNTDLKYLNTGII